MLRTILKRRTFEKDEDIFVTLPNGKKRTFANLMSHKEQILNDPEKLIDFEDCCVILNHWISHKNILLWFSKENFKIIGPKTKLELSTDLLEIFGKIMINSIPLAEKEIIQASKQIGRGLFLGPILDENRQGLIL